MAEVLKKRKRSQLSSSVLNAIGGLRDCLAGKSLGIFYEDVLVKAALMLDHCGYSEEEVISIICKSGEILVTLKTSESYRKLFPTQQQKRKEFYDDNDSNLSCPSTVAESDDDLELCVEISDEQLYVGVCVMFWAHCLIVDEVCPLKVWFHKLCSSYCNSVHELNQAISVLMKWWLKV